MVVRGHGYLKRFGAIIDKNAMQMNMQLMRLKNNQAWMSVHAAIALFPLCAGVGSAK